jgi:cytochrome c biogenesis protein CcdA
MGTAVVDSINPCAFSVLFLTIAFLFSLGSSRAKILKVGGIYILGIFLAYLLIGFGLLKVLNIFNLPKIVAEIGATLIILAGVIHLINHFFPRFPIKLKIPNVAHHKIAQLMHEASLPAAFLLGVLVGVTEFPCTGGPYLTAIGLLHDNTTLWSGVAYLIIYNLVFVFPLIIVLALSGNKLTFQWVEKWRQTESGRLNVISSIVMIILGAIIIYLQL